MPFLTLSEVQPREPMPGWTVRFVHSQMMTFAHWRVEPGAALPEHAHPHEQVANFIEGQFELTVAGETRTVGPGHVAIIPPNAPHSGRAITACRILDAFYPIREDYR